MLCKSFTSFLFFLSVFATAFGQTEPGARRTLSVPEVAHSPVIDGVLSDSAWQGQEAAQDFTMLSPGIGTPAPDRFSSRVKLVYTDEALFVGAYLHDAAPDSILHQVTTRDVYDENTDWFMVSLNPFNDGQNQFKFVVTAAGTKADLRTNANGQDDPSYNTIWRRAVRRHDSGWTVEMAIPYVALRFPKNAQKGWGANFIRSIRRNRHIYSWNPVNRGSGFSQAYQAGLLKGLADINPPVRLSLMPYFSAYSNDYQGNTTYDAFAGMDLKYGLGPAFTLDMTLVPDFGQVAFDNQFLNLSPFENRFQENRQFFNEGTELFSIGDLFYSRRIGGTPKNITNQNINTDQDQSVRTEYTKLINASKVSGRTRGNLGVGVLNAVTDNSYQTYTDTNGRERRQLLEPLTNYNMIVLDQRFNRNSSVSFVNTNVLREGRYLDANVAGLLTSLYTTSGQYRLDASLKRSDRLSDTLRQSGHEASLRIGDVDGHWRWASRQTLSTDQFDINDMGFQARNNQWRNYSEVEYLTFEPSGIFNRTSYSLYNIYSSLYRPQRFEEWAVGGSAFFLLRDFTGLSFRVRSSPVAYYDYFEPRTAGRYLKRPPRLSFFGLVSTDYRRPVALDADFTYEYRWQWQAALTTLNLEPRIRLGDHLFMTPRFRWQKQRDDIGFAQKVDDAPVMGQRTVRNITAVMDARYAFDPQHSLSLRLRQYWSRVRYHRYFNLLADGTLAQLDYQGNENLNFNTLNLDLRYQWWFAPASQVTLLYRVALAQDGRRLYAQYGPNWEALTAAPAQSNLSVKLSLFLDYHQTRQKLQEI
jgi:hypothetical protein